MPKFRESLPAPLIRGGRTARHHPCYAHPLLGKITIMEWPTLETNSRPVILSCDGDVTIREGDWLRLWTSQGVGVAHDVWVGVGGMVYENSGPGGFVRINWLANVLVGRKVIHIVARTMVEDLPFKVEFAES